MVKKVQKLLFVAFIFLIQFSIANAQVIPYGINYQAVARDKDGKPYADKELVVEIKVINNANSSNLYSESHSIKTNKFGLFTLVIGKGQNNGGVTSEFSKVDWLHGEIKVLVSIDFGEGMQDMGEVSLQTVPYAFVADSALKAPKPILGLTDLKDVNLNNIQKDQVLSWNGEMWVPANNILTDHLSAKTMSVNQQLNVSGNIFVSDTITAHSIFTTNAGFSNVDVSDNITVKKNGEFGGNILVGGNAIVADTFSARVLKIEEFEGHVKGTVSDISEHEATELVGISDTGSGRIITDYERNLLNSIPNKLKEDSSLNSNQYQQLTKNDSITKKLIAAESQNRLLSDSILALKIKNDSSAVFIKLYNEKQVRDSVDSSLKQLFSQNNHFNDSALTSLNSKIISENTQRETIDNSIFATLSADTATFNLKLNQEKDSRILADSLLRLTIKNETEMRQAAINSYSLDVQNEAGVRKSTDDDLFSKISSDSLNTRLLLKQEVFERKTSDTIINLSIINESKIRASSDSSIKADLKAEKTNRSTQDSLILVKLKQDTTEVGERIKAESLVRYNSDKKLLDTIKLVKKTMADSLILLNSRLQNEQTARIIADKSIEDKASSDSLVFEKKLSNEQTARITGDSLLQATLNKDSTRQDSLLSKTNEKIDEEKVKRQIDDALLSNRIVADSIAVRILVDNATQPQTTVINALQTAINSETASRISADKNLLDSIVLERNRRYSADSSITKKAIQDSTYFSQLINNETIARNTDSLVLQNSIKAEATARISNFNALSGNIDAEKLNRINADNKISNRIIADSIAVRSTLNVRFLNEEHVRDSLFNNAKDSIRKESTVRLAVDAQLKNKISLDSAGFNQLLTKESNERKTADSAINKSIASETTTREAEIAALYNTINNKNLSAQGLSDRIVADSLNLIDKINERITAETYLGNDLDYETYLRYDGDAQLRNKIIQDSTQIYNLVTKNRSLTLTGNYLNLTEVGNTLSVDISPIGTANHILSLNNNVLSIESGNSVTIPYASKNQNGLLQYTDWQNFNSKLGNNLGNGRILIGNANDSAMPVEIKGDATLLNDGSLFLRSGVVSNSKLQDASITGDKMNSMGAAKGEILTFDGTRWVPAPNGSEGFTAGNSIEINGHTINNTAPDKVVNIIGTNGINVSGTYPNYSIAGTSHTGDVSGSTVLSLQDYAVTTNKIANKAVTFDKLANTNVQRNQVIKFDGTSWGAAIDSNTVYTAGSGLEINKQIITNTAPDQEVSLVGTNGIAVLGTYPNFTINNNAPNAKHTGDVEGSEALTIANDAVSTTKIADEAVTSQKISKMGASNGQVLKFNGNSWIPAPDNSAIYTAGKGLKIEGTTIINTRPDTIVNLTGQNGITITGTYPNFTIIDNMPNATHSGDVNGSTELTIANNAITTSKILDGSVTASKLNNMGAEPGEVLKFNGYNWAPSVPSTVVYEAGTGIQLNGTIINNLRPNATHNGDVTGATTLVISKNAIDSLKIKDSNVTTTKIKDSNVTTAKLADGAVNSEKIAVNAITENKIALNAVTTSKILNEAVTADKIQDFSITGIKITDKSIGSSKLEDGAIDKTKIAAGAIDGTKLTDGAVNTIKIADEAVSTAKLATGAVTSAKIQPGAIDSSNINRMNASIGQVLKYSSNGWTRGNDEYFFYEPDSVVQDIFISQKKGANYHFKSIKTKATSANKNDSIVRRDANGNFAASNITANLIGTADIAKLAIEANSANTANVWKTPRTIKLEGAVIGQNTSNDGNVTITTNLTPHNHVSAEITDATSLGGSNTIVKRDNNGDFSAGTITAVKLNGIASKAEEWSSSKNFTIKGAVTGTANTTNGNIDINTTLATHNHLTADIIDATDAANPNTIVKRGTDGGFKATTIGASMITLLNSPIKSSDAVNKAYVDAMEQRLTALIWKIEALNGTSFQILSQTGATISSLLSEGLTYQQLINIGVTISQFSAAGIPLVQLRNGGVTGPQFIDAGATIPELATIGITIPQLLAAKVSIYKLLNAYAGVYDLTSIGISLQTILDSCQSVPLMMARGASSSSFLNLTFKGGIIFYVNANGTGLIASPEVLGSSVWWSNSGYTYLNTYSDIGKGVYNTDEILNAWTSTSAARICRSKGWSLPSIYELDQLFSVIPNGYYSTGEFWSSTQQGGTSARYLEVSTYSHYSSSSSADNSPFKIIGIKVF